MTHRNLVRLSALFLVLFLASQLAFARQDSTQPAGCPTLKITCPEGAAPGGTVVFVAEVTGGAADAKPHFHWTVTAGKIESGQDSSRIEVNLADVGADVTVTAAVEIHGLDKDCPSTASCSASLTPKAPPPVAER